MGGGVGGPVAAGDPGVGAVAVALLLRPASAESRFLPDGAAAGEDMGPWTSADFRDRAWSSAASVSLHYEI